MAGEILIIFLSLSFTKKKRKKTGSGLNNKCDNDNFKPYNGDDNNNNNDNIKYRKSLQVDLLTFFNLEMFYSAKKLKIEKKIFLQLHRDIILFISLHNKNSNSPKKTLQDLLLVAGGCKVDNTKGGKR